MNFALGQGRAKVPTPDDTQTLRALEVFLKGLRQGALKRNADREILTPLLEDLAPADRIMLMNVIKLAIVAAYREPAVTQAT